MSKIVNILILAIVLTPVSAQIPIGERIYFDSFEMREGVIINGQLVNNWFYFLGFEPTEIELQQMIDSSYDMVVLEPIFTM